MNKIRLSLMELNDIEESARVLSLAMLNNNLHIAVFKGSGEKERLEIERMFTDLLNSRTGIVFLAKDNRKIVGVMRMKSCCGSGTISKPETSDEEDINYRKYIWLKDWSVNDPKEQHLHLGPICVLPEYKRKKIGSMLMDRFLYEVDACNAKAYLETDLDENIIFYGRFGFKLVKTSMILGVESRYMERSAVKDL